MSKNKTASVTANNTANTVKRNELAADVFSKQATSCSIYNMRGEEKKFSNCAISGVDVENVSLENSEFFYAKLTDVNFNSVDLDSCEFRFAELENVTFVNCKLERSYFNFASLHNVHFINCILDRSEFDFAHGDAALENCSLKYCEMPMNALTLVMNHCCVERAEFNSCGQWQINAEDCNFNLAEFNDGKLNGSFKNCSMISAEFKNTDGAGMEFADCKLRDASLRGSHGISENIDGDEDGDDDDFDFDFD